MAGTHGAGSQVGSKLKLPIYFCQTASACHFEPWAPSILIVSETLQDLRQFKLHGGETRLGPSFMLFQGLVNAYTDVTSIESSIASSFHSLYPVLRSEEASFLPDTRTLQQAGILLSQRANQIQITLTHSRIHRRAVDVGGQSRISEIGIWHRSLKKIVMTQQIGETPNSATDPSGHFVRLLINFILRTSFSSSTHNWRKDESTASDCSWASGQFHARKPSFLDPSDLQTKCNTCARRDFAG